MIEVSLPKKLIVTFILNQAPPALDLSVGAAPEPVCFDFSTISFARPTGIVFLHNMTKHLARQNRKVFYRGFDRADSKAMRFMDSIGFFEDHLGFKVFPDSACTETTCRLVELHNADCHGWVSSTFIPWLERSSGISRTALAEVQTCVKEIFNNIQDHAGLDAGSVFAQWYPTERVVDVAIADFGRGIPFNVRRVLPHLSEFECVVQAFVEGFTTKGKPGNLGAGLALLRDNVVTNFDGELNVISGGVVTKCDSRSGLRETKLVPLNRGYTGTLIHFTLPTRLISLDEPEIEDDIWTS